MGMAGVFRRAMKWRTALVGAVLGALAASAAWYFATPRAPQTIGLSSRPQGAFPELAIHERDFLIPLNRLVLTSFVFAESPDENGDWGRNRPATVLVFGIREGERTRYFLASGIQETLNIDVKYLGTDITLESAAVAGNGYCLIEYSTGHDGVKHQYAVPRCLIVGSPPETKNDISQSLKLTSEEKI